MFLGHFGLAFAAKRIVPKVELPVLFAAAQLADILWPVFVATGLEVVRIDPGNTAVTPLDFVSYPYSHSLLALTLSGLAFGLVYRAVSRRNGTTITVLLALVVSHWVLDWVSHRPDMPLLPGGGPKLGLDLWSSVAATLVVELGLFGAGIALYVRATRAKNATGRWALVSLVTFLLLSYFTAVFGPAPSSVTALWMTGVIGGVVFLAWSTWVDRRRTAAV